MRGVIQRTAVIINFRKSNKNFLERRAGAYRSSRKKSPYTKHAWSSSIMIQQEQPFVLVVLPTSDFCSFCKYNTKLSRYHIFSTDNTFLFAAVSYTPVHREAKHFYTNFGRSECHFISNTSFPRNLFYFSYISSYKEPRLV
jgi:hypothetical protein